MRSIAGKRFSGLLLAEGLVSAFLVGWSVTIHAIMLRIPDPLFAPDSAGYLSPAIHLFFGKSFDLDLNRTPCYPLFLYTLLKVTHHLKSILYVQHGLILVMGLGIGYLYFRYIHRSVFGAALVFFLSTALPRPVVYAHYILTETLYTFWALVVFFLLLFTQENRGKQTWLWTGLVTGIAILTRSTGRSLFGILGVAPLLEPPARRRWVPWLRGIMAACGVLFFYAVFNKFQYRFFGLDKMRNTALFCSTADYLNLGEVQNVRARTILKPFYTKGDFPRPGGWAYTPEGPYWALSREFPSDEFDTLLGSLAFNAIKNHPFYFLRDRLSLTYQFLTVYPETPEYYCIPGGMAIFYSLSAMDPADLRLDPSERDYFSTIKWAPVGPPSRRIPAIKHLDRDFGDRFNALLPLWKPLAIVNNSMRWISLLAILGAGLLLGNIQTRGPAALAVFMIGFHAIISTLAAWQDPRFIVPVLPYYYFLTIGGLQRVGSMMIESIL